jgi:hypothetical protein
MAMAGSVPTSCRSDDSDIDQRAPTPWFQELAHDLVAGIELRSAD